MARRFAAVVLFSVMIAGAWAQQQQQAPVAAAAGATTAAAVSQLPRRIGAGAPVRLQQEQQTPTLPKKVLIDALDQMQQGGSNPQAAAALNVDEGTLTLVRGLNWRLYKDGSCTYQGELKPCPEGLKLPTFNAEQPEPQEHPAPHSADEDDEDSDDGDWRRGRYEAYGPRGGRRPGKYDAEYDYYRGPSARSERPRLETMQQQRGGRRGPSARPSRGGPEQQREQPRLRMGAAMMGGPDRPLNNFGTPRPQQRR